MAHDFEAMSEKIVDYTVVEAHELGTLITEVRGLLAKGFEPLGAVQIVAPGSNAEQVAPLFIQSMIRRHSATFEP